MQKPVANPNAIAPDVEFLAVGIEDEAEDMKRIQAALMAQGIAVAYLKYVGAPSGGVLRATVFSTHTPAHIDRLLSELKRTV